MKRLTDLSLFNWLFKPNDVLKLMNYNPNDDGIPHADLEESLRVIQRRYNFPLKSAVLSRYTDGEITLLGNERVNVISSLPAWRITKGSAGKCHTFVNAVPYIPALKQTEMNHRRIYTLLQFGTVLQIAYERESKILTNASIARIGSGIYSRMMLKVVDRIVTLGRDVSQRDKLRYIFAKYFLANMLSRPLNDTTDGIARSTTSGKTSNMALESFEEAAVSASGFNSASSFYSNNLMDFLRSVNQSDRIFSKLTVREFIRTFIKLYGAPAAFAMEEVGYFLAVIAAHTAGAEFVYSFSLDPVAGSFGEELISDLSSIA